MQENNIYFKLILVASVAVWLGSLSRDVKVASSRLRAALLWGFPDSSSQAGEVTTIWLKKKQQL